MRVTVKGLGEHSSQIAELKPGTKVLVEGPYGVFTHHQSVVLILPSSSERASGITPLRALLEDLPLSVDVDGDRPGI